MDFRTILLPNTKTRDPFHLYLYKGPRSVALLVTLGGEAMHFSVQMLLASLIPLLTIFSQVIGHGELDLMLIYKL